MDVKQAIGLLKHHIGAWEGKFPPAHFEACEAAIQALEKQIPKEVLIETIKGETLEKFLVYYCPICGCEVDYNYCQECWQKLDWGVVNE